MVQSARLGRSAAAVLAAFFCASLLGLLAGCTSARFSSQPPLAPLQLDRVYVYSFLGYRQASLGAGFIGELHTQLNAAMIQHGVEVKQVWPGASESPATTSLRKQQAPEGVVDIPVDRVLRENRADEQAFAPSYRLMVYPNALSGNVGQNFSVIWDVVDARTGTRVWSTTSSVRTPNLLGTTEGSPERARVVIDGLIAEMTKSGLFGSRQTPK